MRCPRVFAGVLAVAAFAFAAAATAQTLYKWIDKDGRVHFADKPPVGFKGEVTKIQVDAQPDVVVPRASAPRAQPQAEGDGKDKPVDAATRRRELREQLTARLSLARAKLEAARKALSETDGATEEERQFVRQEFGRDERRPERTPAPRANCMSQKTTDGKAVWNCPRPIPTDAYFERQAKLEEAVRKAEEEVAEAERLYRRSVD